jgi:glucosamine--fructose-6-phosphate aminotransferase (isomerizing)
MNIKREYPHHMLREIHEQPRAVHDTLAGRVDPDSGLVTLETLSLSTLELKSISSIRIVASGTSRYAGLVGKYMIEELAGIPVEVDYSSEFECRRHCSVPPLSIVISQSGETSDTLAALRRAKREGSKTLAICNVENSTMMREADGTLQIKAGPELSVPSTKAFGGQLTCLFLLAVCLAQAKQSRSCSELRAYALEATKIPEKLRSVLRLERHSAAIAERYFRVPDFIFFGRGPHYPIALDGALKLKETAYIHAEGYPSGELKHGQITLVDDEIVAVLIATCDVKDTDSVERCKKVLADASEIKALFGHVVVLATEGDESFSSVAEGALYLPPAPELLLPILEIVPLELMAYHIAVCKGLNPDKPRNLSKAVTIASARVS